MNEHNCAECPYHYIHKKRIERHYCNHPDAMDYYCILHPERKGADPMKCLKLGKRGAMDIKHCPLWCPLSIKDRPIEVDKKTAYNIISTGKPLGVFYLKEGDDYTAIDNSSGNVWIEEFTIKARAVTWLKARALITSVENEGSRI